MRRLSKRTEEIARRKVERVIEVAASLARVPVWFAREHTERRLLKVALVEPELDELSLMRFTIDYLPRRPPLRLLKGDGT